MVFTFQSPKYIWRDYIGTTGSGLSHTNFWRCFQKCKSHFSWMLKQNVVFQVVQCNDDYHLRLAMFKFTLVSYLRTLGMVHLVSLLASSSAYPESSHRCNSGHSGNGYRFFTVISFKPLYSIQGLRVLSFFSTKKNPEPAGEDEGWIMPATKEWLI